MIPADSLITSGVVVGDPSVPTVINQINPDPRVHIAGSFLVPVTSPAQSNWDGVILGGLAIMALAFVLTKNNR